MAWIDEAPVGQCAKVIFLPATTRRASLAAATPGVSTDKWDGHDVRPPMTLAGRNTRWLKKHNKHRRIAA